MKAAMAGLALLIAIFILLFSVQIIGLNRFVQQQEEIKHLEKEVKELQKQYFNLYNSHNYVLKQVEDMKQF